MPAPETTAALGAPRSLALWARWLPLVVLLSGMGAGYLLGAHHYLSLAAIVDTRDRFKSVIDAQPVLAIACFVVVYAVAVSVSMPGASLFTLAGGLIFGWLAGGLASALAATLGAAAVFLVARSAFGETLAKKAGPQVAKMQAGFRDNALSYLLFLRLVPAFPFFIVNIVPALVGIPFRTYLLGTALGILPGTFAFASIGSGLDSVVMSAKAAQLACLAATPASACPLTIELATLVTPEVKIACGMLGVLALIPVVLKSWRRRHGRATD
jgi:uncharacterized membrane protein YdjX (TVP38/TMEM64 family)